MAQRAISFCNFKLTNSGSPCIGRPCLKRPPWAPRTWRDSPRGSGTPSTTLPRTGRSTSRLSRRLIAHWSNLVTNSGSEQLHDLAVGRRNQPATERGSVFYRGMLLARCGRQLSKPGVNDPSQSGRLPPFASPERFTVPAHHQCSSGRGQRGPHHVRWSGISVRNTRR